MNFNARRFLVVSFALALAACAGTPRVPMQADSKQKIKSIGVVQVPEPERYVLSPGMSAGSAALFLFGAIGAGLYAGIDANRTATATSEFMAVLQPQRPALGEHMNDSLISAVAARGYAVTGLAPLPAQAKEGGASCGDNKGKFDAVLVPTLTAGYAVDGQVEPRVMVSVKLLSADCSQTLYADNFLYAEKEVPNFVWVQRSPEFAFATREALLAGAPLATRALRTGAAEVAKRIAQEF